MFVRVLVLLAGVGFFASAAQAQDMPKPGPEHAKLKELVGEWDATVKMMGGETKAKAVYKLDFNGFFLVEEFEGDFGGMKFKGRGQVGYCPLRKKYVTTWIDNMGPSPITFVGDFSKDGKTLIEEGEGPGMDGKMTKLRSKGVMVDQDTWAFTMYSVAEGKETEMMSITYKRKK